MGWGGCTTVVGGAPVRGMPAAAMGDTPATGSDAAAARQKLGLTLLAVTVRARPGDAASEWRRSLRVAGVAAAKARVEYQI